MKKIISLIASAALLITCCSCTKTKDKDEIFEEFRNSDAGDYTLNDIDNEYYIRISETASEVYTLKEASKLNSDCAFMETCSDGTEAFFRKGKYITSSAATFYVASTQEAQWTDFSYDDIAEKYNNIYGELIKNDSFTVEIKDSDDDDAPFKITAKYDVDSIDTKSLFQNGGNYGTITITFLTDKSGSFYKNPTITCQYDYNSTIYIYSVQFGTPNSPDSNGSNGQRPVDIEKIYESYAESDES